MNKVELLSPAGDFECLKAAINNGADAVYFGGTSFSARKFATNFTLEEIEEAVKYAHLRFKKVYITINTLLDDDEINEAMDLVKKYYEIHVDALIIQDLGLYYRIKKDYPDFEIHASTQMHIHNLSGVKTAKELGFKRVIVARESSLEDIKKYCQEGIEIECFVHGAICVSYSGQCLMSSLIKDRSANRGECAQMCRMKYRLVDEHNLNFSRLNYLLSPKDMMLIKEIPSLIEAGVHSFKIEGRLKSAAYVAFVTKLYRQAIDAYYNNEQFNINAHTMNNLKVLFNRGYSSSYLKNNNDDLFNNIRPNNMGIEIGSVVDYQEGNVYIKLKRELKLHDAIRILNDKEDAGTEIYEMYVDKYKIEKADRGETVHFRFKTKVPKGSTVLKTQDNVLEKELLDYIPVTNDIDLSVTIKLNTNINIKCTINGNVFNYSSELTPVEAINAPLSKENIINQFNKSDIHPYNISKIDIDLDSCFIELRKFNEVRRDFYNKLDDFVLSLFKRSEALPCQLLDNDIKYEDHFDKFFIQNNKHDDYVLNPIVNLDSNYKDDNNIVSEIGGLLLKGNKVAFYSMNVYNSYAYELLLKLGFNRIILSAELNDESIEKLINAFKARNRRDIKPYVFVKGPVNLMNIYKNIFDNDFAYIKDYEKKYKINSFNDYTSLTYEISSLRKHKKFNMYNEVVIND